MSRCAPRTPRAVASLAWLLAAACHAQPGTAPMMAATAATAAALQVPPALQSRWTPVSKSLSGAGPLSLSAHTLTWSPCGPAPRAITAQNGPEGWLLTLPGQTGCRLTRCCCSGRPDCVSVSSSNSNSTASTKSPAKAHG